ncbi:armadillo repeat-containing protein 3-like isoform X2 [Poeciliopsis prolifica]|uniref:armadillo repeat-containing protein 3-like isoform X2 n=1 Tax=Poeciliopsis prolifica TaxID=188132 RepID=UPI002413A824|nr:armadillo repeat-containing protein 3-like isoform X2 [Poeciliopsis prolifica]
MEKEDPEAIGPLSLESKVPATVVLLLSSQEEDILVKASEAIRKFAEKGEENRVRLLGLGALGPLCKLIDHSNEVIKRNALMAVGTMATNGEVSEALKKEDVIPLLLQKLTAEGDVIVQEFATLSLASMAADFNCRVQINTNDGMPPLIKLLSSPDPDVTKNSLEIIFNLVQDLETLKVLHELGAIPPLLELLKSDFPVIQHLALQIFQCVTTDLETQKTFREEQGFERFMDLLDNMALNDLHAEALQTVSNCLGDMETLQLIHKNGGLIRLMEFVLAPSSPEIQCIAIKCITMAAQSSESRDVLHKQEIEKVLVELLSAADDNVKTSACQAIAAMSLNPCFKHNFRDLEGIPPVVQLLRSESSALREAATQALSSLTHCNKANALAVYEAGGHQILIQQLSESSTSTVASSAATLCNMAEQEIIQSSILSQGGVQALVEPLQSTDTQVLMYTALCVAKLACNNEEREKFHKAGGLEPLVNLLYSKDKELLKHACLAVNVCARDTSCAVKMCKLGALEILQKINQSANRSFSELAITSLLNSNLPVKYSRMGCLTPNDIITSGFYDVGKAFLGQPFLTLEELINQPLNQKREIIAFNIPMERQEEEDNPDEELHDVLPEKSPISFGDVSLLMLIKEAKDSVLSLKDEGEQYAALARLVSEAMGGAVPRERLHELSWMLHQSELRFQLKSNVLPIGMINKGTYCHRAFLFKCLADTIGKRCSLVRGDYNRAWNEVIIFIDYYKNPRFSVPCRYIVDLMHQPGTLLPIDSPAAQQYQTI